MLVEQFDAVTNRYAEIGGGGVQQNGLIDADNFAVGSENRAARPAFVSTGVVSQVRVDVADMALS